uniref:RNA-directed DNA polymerase n=1 Tax=Melampsora lini TaxID=5261 RepID=Q6R662_MELLI|nr:polyprotein [Melampsora lini]
MKDTRIIDEITIFDVNTATTVRARALVDSGATHEAMSKSFVMKNKLTIEPLEKVRSVTAFSGHESRVTHSGDFIVNSSNSRNNPTTFIITELRDKYDVILGMPWIKGNHQQIDWKNGKLIIQESDIAVMEKTSLRPKNASTDCQSEPERHARFLNEGVECESSLTPPQCEYFLPILPLDEEAESNQKHCLEPFLEPEPKDNQEVQTAAACKDALSTPKNTLMDHVEWEPERHTRHTDKGVETALISSMPPQSTCKISSLPLLKEYAGKRFVSPTQTIRRLQASLPRPNTKLRSLKQSATLQTTMIDVAKTSWNVSARLAAEQAREAPTKSASELVPQEYHDYLDMFEKSKSDALPPHRPYDFRVDLVPGAVPQAGKVIPLSPREAEVLNEMLEKGLRNGTIRRTTSPWAAPVLFTGKKDGNLRPCFDYRKLNAVTIKNKYPLPLTMELVDSLLNADQFTSLDMRNGYNNLRVREGDEAKLAFICKEGQFEPLTMPFGPTGAPGFFQFFIQDILRGHIGRDVAAYQDDILIYTGPGVDHKAVVREVLEILKKQNVWLKPEKCKFSQKEISYLGLIISRNQIKMDKSKVKAVTDWPVPQSVSDVQTFLGFSNFYRRFIHHFSKIARPLHELSKKGVEFKWNDERNRSFETLKAAFTSAPVLKIADPYRAFVLECDCSDYALGAVLSQISEDDGELHPVAYLSRSLIQAERNYEIFDKELLAVVASFKEWRQYLEGNPHRLNVVVYTDHKNLQSLMTTKELTRRQARWAEILGSFDFEIRFRPGKQSTKPDALSRRPDLMPEEGTKLTFGQLLKPENLPEDAFIDELDMIELWIEQDNSMIMIDENELEESKEEEQNTKTMEIMKDSDILFEIKKKSQQDEDMKKIMSLCEEMPQSKLLKGYHVSADVLYFQNRVVVPNDKDIKVQILRSRHDSLLAGHPGRMRTLALLKRSYYWKSMKAFVNNYVDGCQSCQRVKSRTEKPFGTLQPLPIPQGPWQDICYDLITDLPLSDGFDSILTVVDRLTKMAHFISCKKSMNSDDLAELMIKEVWRLHGTPNTITSDRGNVFISRITKDFHKRLGIKTQSSTAYHPQTDGQTEITNKAVEQFIRHFASYKQDNWNSLLPFAEFSYNNNQHSAIGVSPFKANYGFDVTFTDVPSTARCVPVVENRIEQIKEVQRELKDAMALAQQEMTKRHDLKSRPTPTWKKGDKVWLNGRHLSTTRPTAKFSHRWLGPFMIIDRVSKNAYKLDLPKTMNRVHPVFHVNLLRKFESSKIQGQDKKALPPIIINEEEEFEVNEVLDKRRKGKSIEYLINWKGYGPEYDTWEPESGLQNAREIVKEFNDKYPNSELRYTRKRRMK